MLARAFALACLVAVWGGVHAFGIPPFLAEVERDPSGIPEGIFEIDPTPAEGYKFFIIDVAKERLAVSIENGGPKLERLLWPPYPPSSFLFWSGKVTSDPNWDQGGSNAVGDVIGWSLASIDENYLHPAFSISVSMIDLGGFYQHVGAQFTPSVDFGRLQLVFSSLSGTNGGPGGPFSFRESAVGGFQRASKQANGPDAYTGRHNTKGSHYPLGGSVAPHTPNAVAVGGGWWLLRLGIFAVLAFPVMGAAARFSGRDWGRSTWRFYGGLVGGLLLWLGSGVLILGWPLFRFYGLLP